MTARIARRLTRSDLVGTLAGLLLAVEGMHLVMSRSGLLDMVLAFWVLAAFGLLLIDRDRTRGRLADLVRTDGLAAVSTDLGAAPRAAPLALGRRAGPRPRLQREVVGPVVPRLLHPHVPRVGRLRPAGRSACTAPGGRRSSATPRQPASRWSRSPSSSTSRPGRAGSSPTAATPGSGPLATPSRSFPRRCGRCGTTTRRRGGSTSDLSSAHPYGSNALSWFLQARPTSFYYENVKDGSGLLQRELRRPR